MESEDQMEVGKKTKKKEKSSGIRSNNEEKPTKNRVYVPTAKNVGEELEMDKSSYVMYHHATTGAPCLSFDIIKDNCGDTRTEYPLEAFIAAGTQTDLAHTNSVLVMRFYNLHPLHKTDNNTENDEEDDDDSESNSDSDEEDNNEPELSCALLRHQGSVNRIRTVNIDGTTLAATWSEKKKVHIWDLSNALNAVCDYHLMATFTQNDKNTRPLYTFSDHASEGFAIDWSPIVKGNLASGDCIKNIYVWKLQNDCTWSVGTRPYVGHTDSVEDIQWSPNEATVFASCSIDKSIRIWDCRAVPDKACMLTVETAHDSDVNVISWNRNEPFLVSGGDDGVLKVWDLRLFKESNPSGVFKHHFNSITSVEWHPTDSTVFAASGADEQVTLWDLAAECEDMAESNVQVPPQLLFIHQGQQEIKEIHWHQQLPGVLFTTAQDGFNVFRTISI